MAQDDTLPFDLRALEVFLAVCDAGGMAAAARRLGLTQPAVSQTIADMEARAGLALFDRSVRPIGLTAAGGVLRQRGSALLADARQIAPLLRETRAGRLALIRVGMVDSLSRAVTARLAAHLAEVAGQVSFFSGLTASHAGALLTRQLDLFLGSDDLEDVDGLERWTIVEEPYVLALPKGMALPADLATLGATLPLARFSARSRTGADVERHLRRLRLELPRTEEYDTPFGVTTAVAAGRAWAITTPLCLYESGLGLDTFACHPFPPPGFRRHLTLVARTREFGRVPRQAAAVACSAIHATALPQIAQAMPFAASAMAIGRTDPAWQAI